MQDSSYSHSETFGLGNYRGNAFTTGCNPQHFMGPDNPEYGSLFKYCTKTEIFDMAAMQWYNDQSMATFQGPPDYPFISNGPPDYPFTSDEKYVTYRKCQNLASSSRTERLF